MKKIFFLIILLSGILISACNKKDIVKSTAVFIKLDSSGYTPPPISRVTFSYKIGDWTPYQYSGGPDEDSLLFYKLPRIVIDPAFTLKLENIEKVSLKFTNGTMEDIPRQPSTGHHHGYNYFLYENNGPVMHLNWWQVVRSTRPPVDSAFVYIKY
jgi:hypothetical protein